MANTRVFFSDLKSGGKCSSVVEARLLRYWEAQNVKRGGDLMWVDRNAIAELGRLLMYETSREWLLEGLSPYRFCKSHHTRDVKSANVLLDEKFMAKVSELGLPKTGPYLDQTYVSLAVKGSFGYVLDQLVKKAKIEEIIDQFLDWK
ncbi:probable receptor-like serine/threonine-protein kinase At4g34500 [Brassica napus]|uniref:probable receptor-like serine/threonine-protein kinase At4g34500 n=1 Tax=Brassica napus TaxID=3708 RepID=UPI002079A481|nr:probable receptor-like serine/threonine-protein kinase At4g34500 [Brassica napus]